MHDACQVRLECAFVTQTLECGTPSANPEHKSAKHRMPLKQFPCAADTELSESRAPDVIL